MSKRMMTIKGFVSKATSTRLTAEGFLTQYRTYLTTGEVADITSPILAKVDSGELNHQEALSTITNSVFAHMLNQSILKAQQQIAKQNEPAATDKNHLTKLFSKGGRELKREAFSFGQQAQRAGERWLIDSEPGCYVQIETLKLKTRDGKPLIVNITRDDAFANQLKNKKGPVTKGKPVSTGKLGFVMRAKNDRCHFSHG